MRNHMAAGWFYSPSQIGRYLLSRLPTLKPQNNHQASNPLTVLRQLDKHQWLMFAVGFIGWTWDAFDFFTVSLTVTEIAKDFGEKNSDVTWGITITLMLRSVGALIFGSLSDRYGRKWPFIFNLFCFIILELCTGFTNTLPQFLGVRSLYGIAMGGLYGPAGCTAMEDLPYEARGILSGLYQQGYAVGYLLAAVFYRALVPTTSHGWRSLFWFGAGPPVLIIWFRWMLPETNAFLVMKAEREAKHAIQRAAGTRSHDTSKRVALRAWLSESGKQIKENWFLLIYMVVLMAGFNACSHGSQDLYPTFLKDQVELDATNTTVVTVVGQIGALIGGTTLGYVSSMIGRRLTMILACICGGALVPAYILVRDMRLVATAFFEQFFVGGVWGPIPIHLMELSPPALKTLVVGTTYQLGNLASAASATIESTIGEEHQLPPKPDGTKMFDYGTVIATFMGGVWAYQLFWLFFGPEISNEERAQIAAASNEHERLRKEGMNLTEVGAMLAEKNAPAEHREVVTPEDEKAETHEPEKVV